MRMLSTFLFVTAAVLLGAQTADARDGCGRGWYFDGYSCRPYRADYGPRYAYPPRYERPIYGESSYGEPEIWFRPRYGYGGRGRCPPGFTVQDGVCKRYRGY